MKNVAKGFDILAINLSGLNNYCDSLTKSIFNFVGILANRSFHIYIDILYAYIISYIYKNKIVSLYKMKTSL